MKISINFVCIAPSVETVTKIKLLWSSPVKIRGKILDNYCGMIKNNWFSFLVVIISMGGALFCARLLYIDVYLHTSSADGLVQAGYVKEKNDTVKRKLSDNLVWDLMKKNDKLYWDDSIETANHSQVTLALNDGNEIILGAASLVILSKDNDQLSLNLKSGQVVLAGNQSTESQIKVNGIEIKNAAGKTLSMKVDKKKGQLTATSISADGSAKQIIVNKNGSIEEKEIPVSLENPTGLYRKMIEADQSQVEFKWQSKSQSLDSLEIAKDSDFGTIFTKVSTDKKEANLVLNPGQYFWRVRDLSAKKETLSEVRSFEIVRMEAPKLLDPPSKNKILYTKELPTVEFTWQQSNESTGYLIEASYDQSFNDVVLKEETPKTSFKTSKLSQGQVYWRVSAFYGGDRKPSSISEFEIKKSIETLPPKLLSPDTQFTVDYGFYTQNHGIPFKWSKEDQVSHKFVIGKTEDLKAEVMSVVTDDLDTVYNEPLSPGNYYWSVGYRDNNDEWIYKEVRSFTVLPLAPLLNSPKILTTKTVFNIALDNGVSLKWDKVEGATEYKFKLLKVNKKQNVQVENSKINQLELTKEDLADGNYKWFVSAVDEFGRESKPSEQTFHVIHARKLESPEFEMDGVQ